MALDPSSLLEPEGPIDLKFFPGENSATLEDRLDTYLTSAYTDPRVASIDISEDDGAKQNRAARALALYTAFMAVYRRMLAEPLTVTVTEKGSHGYSANQADKMKEIALDYFAEFEDAVAVVVEEDTPVQRATTARAFLSW